MSILGLIFLLLKVCIDRYENGANNSVIF